MAGGGLATLSAPSLHRETRVAGLECQDYQFSGTVVVEHNAFVLQLSSAVSHTANPLHYYINRKLHHREAPITRYEALTGTGLALLFL